MSEQRIILCKGLPGSGKSTWSKQFCADNPEFVRINKDDLRILLGDPIFTFDFEKKVLEIERLMGNTILSTGKSLIVDDGNFAKKHEKYWTQISKTLGIAFDVLMFDTPLEECIRRDSARPKPVGKSVILDMYKTYLNPDFDIENYT